MPVNPTDILAIAARLSEHNTEAAHRSAVSRAYYSVYHHGLRTVKAKLPPVDLKKYSKGCHQRLGERLIDGKTSDWRDVAEDVEWLRDARVTADYHLGKPSTAIKAKIAIQRAQRVLRALEAL
jgi:uncharacterized protein (UPF0332 family)